MILNPIRKVEKMMRLTMNDATVCLQNFNIIVNKVFSLYILVSYGLIESHLLIFL